MILRLSAVARFSSFKYVSTIRRACAIPAIPVLCPTGTIPHIQRSLDIVLTRNWISMYDGGGGYCWPVALAITCFQSGRSAVQTLQWVSIRVPTEFSCHCAKQSLWLNRFTQLQDWETMGFPGKSSPSIQIQQIAISCSMQWSPRKQLYKSTIYAHSP